LHSLASCREDFQGIVIETEMFRVILLQTAAVVLASRAGGVFAGARGGIS
jgi:hypothetical protein